nr:phage tail protein [Terribacillus aidingensis]
MKMLKERYVIKFSSYFFEPEWYVITGISKSNSTADSYSVTCKLAPHSLIWRKMRVYEVTSYSLKQVMEDILKDTGLTIGYINPEIQLKARSFDVSGVTRLDLFYTVCETFKVIPQFDTALNKIHFYKEDELSEYKGFINRDGKYMDSITDQIDIDQLVTRLIVTGKDGLSINGVNPTGQSYVDDFSFYLYPFQRDENRNVIQSSEYMTDDLAHAILDYNELVNKTNTEYKQFLDNLTAKQKEQLAAETELFNKKLEKEKALDFLETRKSIQGADLTAAKADADAKVKAYDDQKKKIDTIKSEVTAIQDKIGILKGKLKLENNLSPALLAELEQNFIHEEEWSNDNIYDESELYDAGIEQLAEMNTPPVNVTTNIVNFFEVSSEKKNWNRLSLGDIIRNHHRQLDIDIKAKVIEMTFDFDQRNISITLSNQKRVQSDAEKVISALYAVEKAKTEYNAKKANYEYTHQNFTLRNDRISTTPADPTLPTSPISHTENDNGSVDLTLNWDFPTDEKDEHNIDGFQLYLYSSNLSDKYVFGATNAKETEINVNNPVARSYTFSGIPANLYYSIAVQAYRRVDTDVNVNGIILSEKISNKEPYRPKASIEMKGNVAGKLNDINFKFSEEDPPVDGEANVKITSEGGFEVYDFEQQKYISKYDVASEEIKDDLENVKDNIDKIKDELQVITDEDTLIRDNLEDFQIDTGKKLEEMQNLQKELEDKATALEEKAAGMVQDIADKADLEYVNGELIAKVDLTQYEEEYNTIRDDLLKKVDIEKYQQEYDAILESLIGKADDSTVDSKLAELNRNLQASLQEVETAKANISTVRQDVTNALAEIEAHKDAIAVHGGQLSTISTELDEVKGSFAVQAQTLTDLDGKMSKARADISLNSQEIASRVKQLDFDNLGEEVSSQETLIQQQATSIGLKANATDVYKKNEVDTALGNKVDATSYNEKMSSIDLTVNGINQKVSNQETVLNELDDTVLSHSTKISEIDQKADSISLKVSETEADLENVKDSVSTANAEIKLNKEAIALKAEKIEMDDLGDRLATTESSLTVMNDAIASKVGQEELNTVTGRLATAESNIEQTSTAIKSKVEQTDFDLLNGKFTNQTAQINTLADQINLQVSEEEFNNLSDTVASQGTQIFLNKDAIQAKADKTTLDIVTGRLEVAESNMIANSNAIEQRVTKTEFDKLELGGRNYILDSEKLLTWATPNPNYLQITYTSVHPNAGKYLSEDKYYTLSLQVKANETMRPFQNIVVGKIGTDNWALRLSETSMSKKPLADGWVQYSGYFRVKGDGNEQLQSYVKIIVEGNTGNAEAKKIQLEDGTKVSSWSAAPEDTGKDISNLDNRMTKAETSITQTANDITFKADKSTTYTKSEVEGKLYEVNLKISDANTLITQNTEAIKLKASSSDVYTRTQADNLLGGKAGKGEFDALVTKVNLNSSELAVQSDAINARVTRDEYENLEFGATNLMDGSGNFVDSFASFMSNGATLSTDKAATYRSFNTIKVVGNGGLKTVNWIELEPNTTYTYSITAKADKAIAGNKGTPLHMWLSSTKASGEHKEIIISHNSTIGTTFGKSWITFKTPNDNQRYYWQGFVYNIGTAIVNVANFQLEKGNKASDWRLSASDQTAYVDSSLSPVKERVSQSEASLKIQADRIEQLVTKTESNAGRISQAETRISQTESDIELRATKTEVANKVDQGTYSKFVTDTNASLKVANDAIATKVSSSQLTTGINEAINQIKIGSRNLLVDTDFSIGGNIGKWKRWSTNTNSDGIASSVTFTTGETKRFMRIESIRGATQGTTFGVQSPDRFNVVAGQEYVLSFLVAVHPNAENTMNYTYLMYDDASNQGISTNKRVSEHKVYGRFLGNYDLYVYEYVIKFTARTSSDSAYILLGDRVASDLSSSSYGLIFVSDIQLEKGNVPTDYSPSPEDIKRRISQAESSIAQQASEIKLKVSQSELNAVTNRLSTAESSITQQANQINLRVEKNNVLSAIKLTPEKIKISTDRLLIGDFANYASWENKGDQNTSPWGADAIVDTSTYKSSNSSFRIPPGKVGIGLKRDIPVQGGDKIYYSFWIKTDSNWNGKADNSKLRFGNQNGALLAAYNYQGVKPNWTFIEGVYTVPSTGVSLLQISIGNDGTTGNIWLDDITLTKQMSAVKIEDGAIKAKHLSVEGIDAKYITSGTLDAGRITVQGGSGNEYAKIDGALLSTRGQYSRTWFGQTESLDSEITVGGGMVRITKVNDSRGRRNLYFTNNGISTTAVGADGDEGTGSGVVEFFSHMFDTERRGLTLYSNLGTIGLKTDSRDIVMDAARDTIIMASTGRVILRPKDDNRVGNNHFSFTVKQNSSSSDTDGVLQYGSPLTNFGSSLRFGKSSVNPTVWVTNGNGDYNTGDLVARDVTATRDLIGNIRSSSSNIYMMGDGEVRVVDSKGYNGGNMTYRPVRAGSFPTGSSIKFKSNLEKFETHASELVSSQQVWTYHLQSNLDKLIFDKPKVGFINEMVNPLMRDEDGVDPYSIVSILWKSQQEQIEAVKNLLQDYEALSLALNAEISRNNKLESRLNLAQL